MDTLETAGNIAGVEEANEIARELAWMYTFLTEFTMVCISRAEFRQNIWGIVHLERWGLYDSSYGRCFSLYFNMHTLKVYIVKNQPRKLLFGRLSHIEPTPEITIEEVTPGVEFKVKIKRNDNNYFNSWLFDTFGDA